MRPTCIRSEGNVPACLWRMLRFPKECITVRFKMIPCFHDIGLGKKIDWRISPDKFEAYIKLMSLTPKKNIEIHFDDARIGVYKYAYPLLKDLIEIEKFRPVIFVVTNWIDRFQIPEHEKYSEFLTWRQLQELHQAGFEIGSHTKSHQNLCMLSSEIITEELEISKKIIENNIGCIVSKLSYPYGDCNLEIVRIAAEHYKSAFQLKRFPETGNWTLQRSLFL